MPELNDARVAVYLDFDNIVISRYDQVNGRKALWAAIIAVNFVGPLSYFRWGRRRDSGTRQR